MQVRAIRDCFVDGTYRKADEEFSYAGPKNHHLKPVTSARKKDEEEEKQGSGTEESAETA